MTAPYYQDDAVTLWHGDSREITDWLEAAVLVTDPPYGRAWQQGAIRTGGRGGAGGRANDGIAGDSDTTIRDAALMAWGPVRATVAFGDLMLAPPVGTRHVLIYRKPSSAGVRGAIGGYRRDSEAIYLIGTAWPSGLGGRSSVLDTATANVATGPSARYGHPHAKPLDLMEALIDTCPRGVIADPFAGSGSTLVAARNLGRKAIGVELNEWHCEVIAKRLAQDVLDLGAAS